MWFNRNFEQFIQQCIHSYICPVRCQDAEESSIAAPLATDDSDDDISDEEDPDSASCEQEEKPSR